MGNQAIEEIGALGYWYDSKGMKMPRGGARKGAGRKKGSANVKSRQIVDEAARGTSARAMVRESTAVRGCRKKHVVERVDNARSFIASFFHSRAP